MQPVTTLTMVLRDKNFFIYELLITKGSTLNINYPIIHKKKKIKFVENKKYMNTIEIMKQEVKKYIETADPKVVKMVHAMLEVDADNDWWDTMPDKVKADVEAALAESERGDIVPHSEIRKRYKKWLVK